MDGMASINWNRREGKDRLCFFFFLIFVCWREPGVGKRLEGEYHLRRTYLYQHIIILSSWPFFHLSSSFSVGSPEAELSRGRYSRFNHRLFPCDQQIASLSILECVINECNGKSIHLSSGSYLPTLRMNHSPNKGGQRGKIVRVSLYDWQAGSRTL